MSEGKSILVDTTLCTACRGCQVACKQWNQLPGIETKQTGTYQNPPDFTPETYKVVRFSEGNQSNGKPYWYFFSDMCRHCTTPPCQVASNNNEIVIDEATGAVLYNPADSEKIDFDMAKDVCPYNVPRQNPSTKKVTKCTMCVDRIKGGRQPACVTSCPTGAMVFGERKDILAKAEKRVAELKKTWPKAKALDADSVRVIYIVTDDPKKYSPHAEA